MTRKRIGIAGWAACTGLSYMNYDMWHMGFADVWLAVEHPKVGFAPQVLPPEALLATSGASAAVYHEFLDSIDILVFCERPVANQFPLLQEALRRGIVTCCIPMLEWLPPVNGVQSWVRQVDAVWAPTGYTLRELQNRVTRVKARYAHVPWFRNIWGGRWGVNLDRFPFTLRTRCNEFLFCNGYGGAHGRKGLSTIVAAWQHLPNIPLLVRSQRDECAGLPAHAEVLVDNVTQPCELYARGDVLLAPSRFEGLGLQLYEAQACGLPVITTAAPPMDECMPLSSVPATMGATTLHSWSVPTYDIRSEDLAAVVQRYHGIPLSAISQAARDRVEAHCNLAHTLEQLRTQLEALADQRRAQPPSKVTKQRKKPNKPTIDEARRHRRPRK